MPFDLSVTISMYFYERCQTKRDVQISDLRREIPYLRSVCLFSPPQGGGGGGGALLYFHAYVGSAFFGGFKVLYFNILGGVQKTEYFWGY